jgi:hypothetical protein
MARYLLATSAFLWLALLGPTNAQAHNTFFLPGDAFFHTVLTGEVVQQFQREKNVRLSYKRPADAEFAFCGYAGFQHLDLVDAPRGLKENVAALYRKLREKRPAVFDEHDDGTKHEVNGFHLFAYNADFDFANRHIGLRYNENWVEETMAFGHRREHVFLEEFVRARKATSEDWRDAASVKSLAADCPKAGMPRSGRDYDPALLRQGYVLVVAEREGLEDYFLMKEGATYYTLAGDQVARNVVQLGEWNKHPWSEKD